MYYHEDVQQQEPIQGKKHNHLQLYMYICMYTNYHPVVTYSPKYNLYLMIKRQHLLPQFFFVWSLFEFCFFLSGISIYFFSLYYLFLPPCIHVGPVCLSSCEKSGPLARPCPLHARSDNARASEASSSVCALLQCSFISLLTSCLCHTQISLFSFRKINQDIPQRQRESKRSKQPRVCLAPMLLISLMTSCLHHT